MLRRETAQSLSGQLRAELEAARSFDPSANAELEQAAREWPIDTGASFLVGDRDDDMAAAAAFNIRGVKFNPQTDSLIDVVRRELAKSSDLEDRLRS